MVTPKFRGGDLRDDPALLAPPAESPLKKISDVDESQLDEPDRRRLAVLRMARDRVVEKLEDDGSKGYTIAPLSNQLRLLENAIANILRPLSVDDGLPSTPDKATFVDFLWYRRQERRGWRDVTATRRGRNAHRRAYDDIVDSWRAAGFVPPPYPDDRDAPDEHRAAVDEWVESCRHLLAEALASSVPEVDS